MDVGVGELDQYRDHDDGSHEVRRESRVVGTPSRDEQHIDQHGDDDDADHNAGRIARVEPRQGGHRPQDPGHADREDRGGQSDVAIQGLRDDETADQPHEGDRCTGASRIPGVPRDLSCESPGHEEREPANAAEAQLDDAPNEQQPDGVRGEVDPGVAVEYE